MARSVDRRLIPEENLEDARKELLDTLADSSIPDNGLITSQTEASNSSASVGITITMYTMPHE